MNLSAIVCVAAPSNGRSTIDHAARLARWYGAALHLVAPEAEDREAMLNTVSRDVRASIASVAAEDVEGVAAHVRATSADLLLVDQSLRGRTLPRRGSLAAQLARRVNCPTISVPGGFQLPDGPAIFREILHPTDLSPASLQSLEWALRFAQESGGRLTLIHVLDEYPYETVYATARAGRLADESRRVAADITRELGRRVPTEALNWCDIETRVVSGVLHRQIVAAATDLQPDLIVMGIPVRHPIQNLLLGSTSGPVIRGAKWPLLMVPIRASIDQKYALAPGRALPRHLAGNTHESPGAASAITLD